jgi:2,3-dihydroxybenzoate decarboxylase
MLASIGRCRVSRDVALGGGRVDGKVALEEHFATPEYNMRRPPFLAEAAWPDVTRRLVDFDDRLAAMDRHGIQYTIVSLTSPGVQGESDPAVAIERARRANDILAEAVAVHPDRFGGFAAVALQDTDAAVDELRRAVTELGFHGVLINSWTDLPDGIGHLDQDRFAPFWQQLEELHVPLYLHPRTFSASQREIMSDRPVLAGPVWEFGAECSASALRLITSGLLDRYPSVQVILGHLGEGVPYDIWRVENRLTRAADRPELGRTVSAYLRENFYVTTSGHFCTPSLRAAIETVGLERVMFSVDYPYESTEQAATWFDALELDSDDKRSIGSGNASRLFGLELAPR